MLPSSSGSVKSKILLFFISTGRERKIIGWPLNNGNSKARTSSGRNLRSLSSEALYFLLICLESVLVLKHCCSTTDGNILRSPPLKFLNFTITLKFKLGFSL